MTKIKIRSMLMHFNWNDYTLRTDPESSEGIQVKFES